MRREKELEATVKQPADAEKFRCEKIAEATRNKLTLEAEAEAYAIAQKAKAEAVTMTVKAEAWKEYKDAALTDMYLEVLPKVCCILFVIYSGPEL